jgi:proteasome lid subunit RPN8/RPN11
MLNLQLKREIREYALGQIPNESVGLILLKDNNYSFFPCKNISYNKDVHCILDPLDYIKAELQGEIVGHVHSHSMGEPSLQDNFTAFNHNIYSIVYVWDENKFYVISPKLKDYLDKDFNIPKSDCFTLVRDYYKIEKNIHINDYERIEGDFKNTSNLILNNFEIEGFRKVDEMKKDDVLLISDGDNNITHMGIYLDNDLILHHPRNTKSCIEYINHHLRKKIIYIMRHKNYE